MTSTRRLGLLLAAVAVTAAACGTATSDPIPVGSPTPDPQTDATTTMAHDHDMDSMNMGDPTAEPAFGITEAEVTSGAFASLPGVTPSDITGTAWLARHAEGTTVTIELEGLASDMRHIAHVHERPCSEGGGAHYRFVADGDHHPPNEIHLAFTTDGEGAGGMTVENAEEASEAAVSVVVHVADDDSPKLACADLTG